MFIHGAHTRKLKLEALFRSSPEYKGTFAGIPTLAVYKGGMLLATTTNELCDAPSHEAALALCELFFDKHNTPSISNATVLCVLSLSLPFIACKAVGVWHADGCC